MNLAKFGVISMEKGQETIFFFFFLVSDEPEDPTYKGKGKQK